MARKNNFLLGNGEKLTGPVPLVSGGGPKFPPYSLSEARQRFKNGVHTASIQVRQLPQDACPGDEAVLSVTMHPRYVSKSDFPKPLFDALGLRSVGSRITEVKPDKWGIEKHPAAAVPTDEIFVAASRNRILQLESAVDALGADSTTTDQLSHIETVSFQPSEAKLKSSPGKDRGWLEVVLHNAARVDVLSAFSKYANDLGATVDIARSRDVGGLTFVPVEANGPVSQQLVRFSFLRVARSMPTLRPLRPTLLRMASGQKAALPSDGVLSTGFRALIFDGGIPKLARPSLGRWMNLIEPKGIGPSHPDFEAHGLAVTSAFLFGPIGKPDDLKRPLCIVDHVRVIDTALLSSVDPYYFDVLERIVAYFDAEGHKYDLINMSIGPSTPVDDGDVTLWTSALDERFASGEWVVTVAAGNDGEADHAAGLDRIQPPGDGVNMLTVGASDSIGSPWKRSSYSCLGPGRCPGIVKPDGLSFGGSDKELFRVLSPKLEVEGIQGTSVSSPFALRSAAAIKAQLGDSLGTLAIRALMIHTANRSDGLDLSEIGWGRFESNPERLITCEDYEVLVVYQGELPLGEYLRAPIPLPPILRGRVEISATLVICTEVDPSYPSAYTRSGLTVAFRPHGDRFTEYENGDTLHYPKTKTFFSATKMYGVAEFELREDGHKWEPCRHGCVSMNESSLKMPCFDIYNHRRFKGIPDDDPSTKAKYALIVSVSAKKVPNLYGAVLRAYSNVLIPLRPKIQIRVGT